MAEEEEGEDKVNNKQHPCPPSLSLSPSPNSRKRKDPKHLVPSLNDCHSCGRHFPEGSQTLTILNSQWRIVLLCDACLCSILSASKCSYCFSDFNNGGGDRVVDCRQCRCRVHFTCVPSQQRFVSLAFLNPETFVCVDCCALPRLGNRDQRSLFSKVTLEDLARDANKKGKAAARAKEKAVEKVMAARCAAEKAKMALVSIVEMNHAVDDEELALKLHLAMNGSNRISRSGGRLDRSVRTKKVKGNSGGCSRSCEEIQLCTEARGFCDSGESSFEMTSFEKKDPIKEIGCSTVSGSGAASIELTSFERKESGKEIVCCSVNGPLDVKEEEERSCFDEAIVCGGENNTTPVFITYQRTRKLKGVGSRESTSDEKQETKLNCICVEKDSFQWEQTSRCDPPDRYALKYSKRKSSLKQVLNTESQLVPYWPSSCSHASILSDTTISSL